MTSSYPKHTFGCRAILVASKEIQSGMAQNSAGYWGRIVVQGRHSRISVTGRP